MPDRRTSFSTGHAIWAARIWCLVWPLLLFVYLKGQLRAGWTDGVDRPFGEDFINFWSAARLAITDRWSEIYDIQAFHAFQVGVVGHSIDLYHYSYPPTLLVLSAPFGLLSYPAAWAVWQVLGWAAFASGLRTAKIEHWLLIAFAWPAVAINALGGQAGCWIAAICIWGLVLLPRRPVAAGLLLSLLAVKPQLAWLFPIALLAGREWRALTAMVAGSFALLAISVGWFGFAIWPDYLAQAQMLTRVILQDGSGVWHRMISGFVLARHGGLPVGASYAVQAVFSAVSAALVIDSWRRGGPARVPVLLTAMLAGSVYVSDYDCVLLALPAAYLWNASEPARPAVVLAIALPLFAAALASMTGLALGALILWPLLVMLARSDRTGPMFQASTRSR